MSVITTAITMSEDAAAEGSQVSPYVFGVVSFVVLCALLVVTMMIKVGD
ncbi:MAG: hypothetical protein ACYC2Z_06705 [Candidatus Nanopelagicales bacterium]